MTEPRYTFEEHHDRHGTFYPITDQETQEVIATLTDTTEGIAYSIVRILNEDHLRLVEAIVAQGLGA